MSSSSLPLLSMDFIVLLLTIFGLFGGAMFWIGKINEKLNSLKKDVDELKKDTRDISIRFSADLLTRNLLDKLQSKPGEGEEQKNNE